MASKGDVITYHGNIVSGGYLDIRPDYGVEWGIQNVYVPPGSNCTLVRTDGTNDILLFNLTSYQSMLAPLNATYDVYFKIYNIGAADTYGGFDGKISKV